MPLYTVKMGDELRLVYAKTPRGAQNHVLEAIRDKLEVKATTPIEGATLAQQGITVEVVGGGTTTVMGDDPPEARRGHKPALTGEAEFTTPEQVEGAFAGTLPTHDAPLRNDAPDPVDPPDDLDDRLPPAFTDAEEAKQALVDEAQALGMGYEPVISVSPSAEHADEIAEAARGAGIACKMPDYAGDDYENRRNPEDEEETQ